MLSFPNGKINIGLYVTEKRSDGYHNIETIFMPINLKDALEIYPDEADSFGLYGAKEEIPKSSNLVWKAYELLRKDYNIPAISFQMIKGIPSGAGLGGGSADAAFCLKMLNDLYNLKLTAAQLSNYALAVGSDCPFFIYNKPTFASGRGEILTPVDLNLSEYEIVLINPGIHVSTKEAFGKLSPQAANFNLKHISDVDISSWKETIFNDFETPIFNIYPEIGAIKNSLYDLGAKYAAMSGTGSTVYGIFELDKVPDLKIFKGKSYFVSQTTFL